MIVLAVLAYIGVPGDDPRGRCARRSSAPPRLRPISSIAAALGSQAAKVSRPERAGLRLRHARLGAGNAEQHRRFAGHLGGRFVRGRGRDPAGAGDRRGRGHRGASVPVGRGGRRAAKRTRCEVGSGSHRRLRIRACSISISRATRCNSPAEAALQIGLPETSRVRHTDWHRARPCRRS